MTCRELTGLCTDYLEGKLGFGERLRFQLHLGICSHCRAYLKQMRGLVRELHAAGKPVELPPPPDAVRAELLERFRKFHRAKK